LFLGLLKPEDIKEKPEELGTYPFFFFFPTPSPSPSLPSSESNYSGLRPRSIHDVYSSTNLL